MIYYSEYGEDKWINENIKLPELGFYVDIGCADPRHNSNTAFLRAKGWVGLAFDANIGWKERWQACGREHEFRPAIITTPGRCKFNLDPAEPTLSRVTEVDVRSDDFHGLAVSIEPELRGVDRIDFLSIDVEGHEFNAIQTLDMNKHNPAVIISEYNTRGIGEDYRVKEYLESLGYSEVHRTIANIVYVR